MNGFVCWKNFNAHFVQIGNGAIPMLAFPGFHRKCTDFDAFKSSLGKQFTIYAFDLFYHGESEQIDANSPFDENELKTMVELFCKTRSINRFALMGYSLGGKIALSVLNLFPKQISAMYLFAPYGLKPERTVARIEHWPIAVALFHYFIKHPGPFFTAIRMLHGIGIINTRKYEFLQHQMESEQRRRLLFNTWQCYRLIKPDIALANSHFNTFGINLKLFYGSLDPVEPPEHAHFLTDNLNQKDTLTIVPVSHNLICEKTNQILAKQLAANS